MIVLGWRDWRPEPRIVFCDPEDALRYYDHGTLNRYGRLGWYWWLPYPGYAMGAWRRPWTLKTSLFPKRRILPKPRIRDDRPP